MKFASKKSSPVDSDALKHKLTEYHQGEVESKTIAYLTKNQSYLELIRSPRLRKRTIILSFNWWVAETYLIGNSRSCVQQRKIGHREVFYLTQIRHWEKISTNHEQIQL